MSAQQGIRQPEPDKKESAVDDGYAVAQFHQRPHDAPAGLAVLRARTALRGFDALLPCEMIPRGIDEIIHCLRHLLRRMMSAKHGAHGIDRVEQPVAAQQILAANVLFSEFREDVVQFHRAHFPGGASAAGSGKRIGEECRSQNTIGRLLGYRNPGIATRMPRTGRLIFLMTDDRRNATRAYKRAPSEMPALGPDEYRGIKCAHLPQIISANHRTLGMNERASGRHHFPEHKSERTKSGAGLIRFLKSRPMFGRTVCWPASIPQDNCRREPPDTVRTVALLPQEILRKIHGVRRYGVRPDRLRRGGKTRA